MSSQISSQIEWKQAVDKRRSSEWPKVRAEHLVKEPLCRACGGKERLEVHHIQPFHLHPELELVDSNLVTLCENPDHNDHLIFGHLLDWQSFNGSVVADAGVYLGKVKVRPIVEGVK